MRRAAIVVLLFSGYAGYYVVRANLSATAPILPLTIVQIGAIASAGTLAYAFGKFFLTWTGDVAGGKRTFLFGMFGAVAFTALFAASSGFAMFLTAWIGNRLSQSVGWAALVKVVSKWFSYAAYGGVMAILSLSFLVGDAVTRGGIGALIGVGFGWRAIFFIAAAAVALLLLVNAVFLRESSTQAGLPPPEVNPQNVFAGGARGLVLPLLRSRTFLIVCALSFGATLLREALATWTPMYFASGLGLSAARAAALSALGPAAGVVSVLAAGWLSDRLGPHGRARITCIGMGLAALTLAAIAVLPNGAVLPAIALIVAVALFNTGPYSYLAGAMALDFGGDTAAAASSGLIDGVGYLGGALAGVGVARLALAFGWGGAFGAMALVAAATSACAALLVKVE